MARQQMKATVQQIHPDTVAALIVEPLTLLNVVVCECPSILKLLASKDKPLLVWWDAYHAEGA